MSRQLIDPGLMREAGWEIAEVGDNGPGTPKKNVNRYERWVHKSKWNKTPQFQNAIYFDRNTGDWSRNGTELIYMDEIDFMKNSQ